MSKRTVLAVLAILLYTAAAAFAVQDRPWSATMLPPGGRLADVAAKDRYHFWAVGESGRILATTDGGTIWTPLENTTGTARLNAVTYDLSAGVVAVGDGGVITQILPEQQPNTITVDAGLQFTGVDVRNQVVIVAGVDENARPVVLRSSDGGLNYANVSLNIPDGEYQITGVRFLTVSDVVMYGSTGDGSNAGTPIIYLSNDAGATWRSSLASTKAMTITAVERIAADWIAVGIQDPMSEVGLYRTLDNGETWTFEEQSDMSMITDVMRGGGIDVTALGIRVINGDIEPIAVVSEFRSTDGGRNWGIVDIANEGAMARMARGGDRIIAVGFDQHSHSRWYDRPFLNTGVEILKKHIELGAIPVGTRRTISYYDVLYNNSTSIQRITGIKLHGLEGVEVTFPKVGDEFDPKSFMSFEFVHERQEEGMVWGVMTISFDDGRQLAMHVSSYSQVPIAEYALQLNADVLDFGNITSTQMVMQQFDVVRNEGDESVTITGVGMVGDDLVAFAYADLPELPLTLQPGESMPLNIMFEPLTKGIYHILARIETANGSLLVPVTASSRVDAVDDVMDLGTVPEGELSEADLYFQHFLWNTVFDVNTVDAQDSPIRVTSTTPLPFEGDPYDRFTVSVSASSDVPGLYASVISVPWTFGGGVTMRADRRIVIAKIGAGDPTSVDEPITGEAPVTVYPQPATNSATVVVPPTQEWRTVAVVDVQGRVLIERSFETGMSSVNLDLTSLTNGMYSVVLRSNTATSLHPLIKQ